MATTYKIAETDVTQESETYSRKAAAVDDANLTASQWPGVTFNVVTGTGKVVHTVTVEPEEAPAEGAPQDAPADQETPATDDDGAAAFTALLNETMNATVTDAEDDVDADFEPETEDEDGLETPDGDVEEEGGEDAPADQEGSEDGDADQEDGEEEAPAPQGDPVAELCAANTRAKRMHYREIGGETTHSLCGSAVTTRRANQHQIDTASMCTACEKLVGGQPVDRSPAGTGRAGGRTRAPKRLVVDASDIRDLVAHLKKGEAYKMRLADGTEIEVVAGDPASDSGEADAVAGDMASLTLVSA